MRFAFTQGQYQEYRGYVFAFGKPTDVIDKASIEAISRDSRFRRIDDEEPQAKTTEAPATEVLNPDACPKCGRVVKQGKAMHIKWCKG